MQTEQVSDQHMPFLATECVMNGAMAEQAFALSSSPTRRRVRFTEDTRTDDGGSHRTKMKEGVQLNLFDRPSSSTKKNDYSMSFTKNFLVDRDMEAFEDSISSVDTLRTSNLRDGGLMDLCDLAALMMPPRIVRPAPLVRKSGTNKAA